jgi:hypothetical protein
MRLRTLVLAAFAPVALGAAELPRHLAADAHSPVVSEQNLLESERFWPYHVALTRPLATPGDQELPAGWQGVLVRVEPDGRARVDFGGDGLHELPIDATDLVDRANRVRRGELEKMAPNLSLAIGTKLWNPAADPPRKFGLDDAMGRPGFLAVFADPAAEGFADLAAALAPLADRHGVLSVLVPQGRHSDAEVNRRLVALGWKPAFVLDYLSAGYTASLIDESSPKPALLLQTNEGRVLFQSVWRPDVVPGLTRALDEAFAPAPAAVRAEAR